MVSWWAHLTTVTEDGPTSCMAECSCISNYNTSMVSKRRSKSPAGVLQPTDESSNESLTDPSIGDAACALPALDPRTLSPSALTYPAALLTQRSEDRDPPPAQTTAPSRTSSRHAWESMTLRSATADDLWVRRRIGGMTSPWRAQIVLARRLPLKLAPPSSTSYLLWKTTPAG